MDNMKPKMFVSYLSSYVKKLSKHYTLDLKTLEREVNANMRLSEVVSLWLLFSNDKQKTLLRYKNTLPNLWNLYQQTRLKYSGLNTANVVSYVHSLDSFDPLRKAYEAYQSTEYFSIKKQKKLFREQILRLQKLHQVTNYRLYTDLNLNHGNINDFLKNNRLEKLSLKNTKRMLKYLNALTHQEQG